jgi:hypothetical protein
MSTSQDMHAVCVDVLTTYVSDPWSWPRESDLVVDLVTKLSARMTPRRVPTRLRLAKPGVSDIGSSTMRSAPRVRTEVKPRAVPLGGSGVSEVADADDDSGRPKQDHGDRIDIAVFKDRTVDTVLHANGARDVVLEVDPEDLDGVLEVKLYPASYYKTDKRRGLTCYWFDDILKLRALANIGIRGLLLVDTSLPLDAVGVTFVSSSKNPRGVAKTPSNLPAWPLSDGSFVVTHRDRSIRFDPVEQPDEQGLFFWSLAVKSTSTWTPTFVRGVVPKVAASDVVTR